MANLPKPNPSYPIQLVNGKYVQMLPSSTPGGMKRAVQVDYTPVKEGQQAYVAKEIQEAAAKTAQFLSIAYGKPYADKWYSSTMNTKYGTNYQIQSINAMAATHGIRAADRLVGDIKMKVFDPATAIAEFSATPKGKQMMDIAQGLTSAAAGPGSAPLIDSPFAPSPPGGGPGALPRGNGAPLISKKVFTDAELRQFVREAYGAYAAFLDMPEIGAILMEAAREGYSKERLYGALSNTNWWKATSETQRMWDAEEITDPGSAKAKLDSRLADIKGLATKAGIPLEDGAANTLAKLSLRSGLSETQLREAAAAEAERNPTTAQFARETVTATGLKKVANDYAIRLSDAAISQWSSRIGFGADTPENFQEYVKQFAKSAYQSIAPELDRGMTVRQWMDPYLQTAGNLLEVDPNGLDLTDPKWLAVLQQPADRNAPVLQRRDQPKVQDSAPSTVLPEGTQLLPGQMKAPPAVQGGPQNAGLPPAGATFQPMTLARWYTELRTNDKYGWDKTKNAASEADKLIDTVLKTFGKR